MSDKKKGVDPEETEIETPSLVDEEVAEEEFHPFDEIHDDYKPTRSGKVYGEDGLPTQDAEVLDSGIPPLSPETLICMGDTSRFVVRDKYGRIVQEFSPDQVKRMPSGTWLATHNTEEIEVEPIRPACKYYARQLGQGGDNPEIKVTYRLCSARRTTEGAFMSVRDTGMWACSLREPRDLASEEKHLDLFDQNKIKEGTIRVANSIFSKG